MEVQPGYMKKLENWIKIKTKQMGPNQFLFHPPWLGQRLDFKKTIEWSRPTELLQVAWEFLWHLKWSEVLLGKVVDQVIDKVLEKEANKVDREVTAYVITDLFINQSANLVISFSEYFPMKIFSPLTSPESHRLFEIWLKIGN